MRTEDGMEHGFKNLSDAICSKCGAYPCMCNSNFVKRIESARDKWWIEQIEEQSTLVPNTVHLVAVPLDWWQSLKQSLEVKE